jgi:hypothetical protein
MKVKKSWKRHSAQVKTYVIKYCIPPDYETELTLEKTGTYSFVRYCALSMTSSGHCIILDISEK